MSETFKYNEGIPYGNNYDNWKYLNDKEYKYARLDIPKKQNPAPEPAPVPVPEPEPVVDDFNDDDIPF